MSDSTADDRALKAVPAETLSLDEFCALGVSSVISADIPVVIGVLDNPAPGAMAEAVANHLGDSMVALFTKPVDPESGVRSSVTKIVLREFLQDAGYRAQTDVAYRVVSNIKNRPDSIDGTIGFKANDIFHYGRRLNSANLWASYRGLYGRTHFDEFENFNLQLEGRKRFTLLPPGRSNFYTRSVLKGFGHHSEASNFLTADLQRFPKLANALPELRDIFLEPGQMLYLPLGWWHQVDSLDDLNININFWIAHPKIVRRPYVFADAVYKAAFRKLKGLYDYQPEPAPTQGM